MHKFNVQILGPSSFISTLNELKAFLKFNPSSENLNTNDNIILFHTEVLQDRKKKDYIYSNNFVKICAGKREDFKDHFDARLILPATIKEINSLIENTVAKKRFSINSSIKIKNYMLDKNERKLSKAENYIIEKNLNKDELKENFKNWNGNTNIIDSRNVDIDNLLS